MSRMYKVGEGSNEMEIIETSGRYNGAPGYTIASILGVIFILAILFWVFNRGTSNHNDAMYRHADHNCQTRERLGILEGEMRSVGTVLNRVVPKLSDLGEFTAAQLGGLNEYTRCSEKEFGQVYNSINTLNGAVFTARCGDRAGHCGRGGNRRFQERQTFALTGTEVDVIDTCNQ